MLCTLSQKQGMGLCVEYAKHLSAQNVVPIVIIRIIVVRHVKDAIGVLIKISAEIS